jgi:methionyl-tRNA formyltransferase
VVAFGRILPESYLSAPKLGCINVHFSLLPLYRGAAPVNWAILNGERQTGVTTMMIEQELDAGPILLQRETAISPKETATELMSRMSYMGADLLSETLANLRSITPRRQNDAGATFAPMLTREHGKINWSQNALAIERLARAMQPWPTAFSEYKSRRLVVWDCEALEHANDEASEGEIILARGDDLIVKCGVNTALRLIAVQPEGSRRMLARDFLNGTRIQIGEKLGTSR